MTWGPLSPGDRHPSCGAQSGARRLPRVDACLTEIGRRSAMWGSRLATTITWAPGPSPPKSRVCSTPPIPLRAARAGHRHYSKPGEIRRGVRAACGPTVVPAYQGSRRVGPLASSSARPASDFKARFAALDTIRFDGWGVVELDSGAGQCPHPEGIRRDRQAYLEARADGTTRADPLVGGYARAREA